MTTTLSTLWLLSILGAAAESPVTAPGAVGRASPEANVANPWEEDLFQPGSAPELPSTPVATWDPLRFGAALEGRTSFLLDDGAKRLAGSRAPTGGGLSLRAEVLRPTPRTTVEVDLSFAITETTQDGRKKGNDLLRERRTDTVYSLGASLRYQLFVWLSPYLRLAGGVGRDKLVLSGGTVDLEDQETYAHGSVGGGLAFRSPSLRMFSPTAKRRFGFTVRVEGGYVFAQGGDSTLRASLPSNDATPIPMSTIPIGKFERSAPYLRVSLGLAF